MTIIECEYSRSISQAIEKCNGAADALQKVIQDASSASEPEAVEAIAIVIETRLIHQKAILDLI
jgi:hypothetical protein